MRDEFKLSLSEEGGVGAGAGVGAGGGVGAACGAYCRQDAEHRAIWRCYCHLADEVGAVGRALGKDGKFQLFICLSLRLVYIFFIL